MSNTPTAAPAAEEETDRQRADREYAEAFATLDEAQQDHALNLRDVGEAKAALNQRLKIADKSQAAVKAASRHVATKYKVRRALMTRAEKAAEDGKA